MGMMSVILPAYNEQERINPMLSDLVDVHRTYPGFLHEVLLIDDGSKDATVERSMKYVDRIPLRILRKENGGKWSAIRLGLRECKGTVICIMDADASVLLSKEMWLYGETSEKWVKFAEMLREPKTIIVGSRFHPMSEVDGKSFVRRIVSRGYKMFVRGAYRYATGRKGPADMQCPYKVLHASHIVGKVEHMTSDRFVGDIELMFLIAPDFIDVPIRFKHMKGSKVKGSAAWQMFRETLRIVKREKYMNKLSPSVGSVVRASGAGVKEAGVKEGKHER